MTSSVLLLDGPRVDDLVDLGLRFDLTVPLVRFFTTNRAQLPRVFKAIQIGPVWRAERPQKGRYRQFTQCDIDIMGLDEGLAEAELIKNTKKVDPIHAGQEPGRNDLCPCGSGQKFKKCCGLKE